MDFNINVEPLRANLEAISLDIPFESHEVIKDLENEDWSTKSEHSSKRSVLITPSSSILKEIKKFISSDSVKEQIINSFYKNFPSIKDAWNGWSEKQMAQKTLWDCAFIKDEPGFFMENHLDTRINIATGIIYLNKDPDEKRTTVYYTDKDGNNELKISNNFCQGVISVNDYNTRHSVRNDTDNSRYIIAVVLILLTEFNDEVQSSQVTLN